jgi:hypothetical protein
MDHVVLDQVDDDLFQVGGNERPGQAKHDCAVFVLQHLIVDLRSPAKIARRKGHLAHRINEWDDVVLLDVDVLHHIDEEIGFLWFHNGSQAGRLTSGYSHFM